MKAIIWVALKETVLDPQGRAIAKALQSHGHPEILSVRQGKYFELEFVSGKDRESVLETLEQVASGVLANPVIEDYEVTLLDEA